MLGKIFLLTINGKRCLLVISQQLLGSTVGIGKGKIEIGFLKLAQVEAYSFSKVESMGLPM